MTPLYTLANDLLLPKGNADPFPFLSGFDPTEESCFQIVETNSFLFLLQNSRKAEKTPFLEVV